MRRYLPLIRRYSYAWSRSLCEGRTFFCTGHLEKSADSYLCFRLALLHSVSYFVFLYRSPSLPLCKIFDSISSIIDELPSINPSANVFVFGDFDVHHRDWLTYSSGTDRYGELCYNFSISNDLTQMVNFPTQIPECDSHSPALLDLIISSDANICSTVAFPPFGNSDNVFVSVSIDSPSNSQRDAPFRRIAYDYSRADVLCGISLNSVLLLLPVNFMSGFRLELMHIYLIVSIRSSLTYIHGFHRTQFFRLCQQNKPSEFKVKFRQASNCCKRILKAAELAYANKTKESITSQKLGSREFRQIVNSILNKGKICYTSYIQQPRGVVFCIWQIKIVC